VGNYVARRRELAADCREAPYLEPVVRRRQAQPRARANGADGAGSALSGAGGSAVNVEGQRELPERGGWRRLRSFNELAFLEYADQRYSDNAAGTRSLPLSESTNQHERGRRYPWMSPREPAVARGWTHGEGHRERRSGCGGLAAQLRVGRIS
jgi:hypothetical protein